MQIEAYSPTLSFLFSCNDKLSLLSEIPVRSAIVFCFIPMVSILFLIFGTSTSIIVFLPHLPVILLTCQFLTLFV
nr:MAG TPA: hypothetical protein [Caudoviricetes sp.]